MENAVLDEVPIEWKMEDFERLKFLGKGAFGKVHLVRHKKEGQVFALKSVPRVNSDREMMPLLQEKEILENSNHPFIVNLKGVFETRTKMCFLMEFVPGGNMEWLLRRETRLTEEATKFYLGELTLAIEYLHQNRVMYRDLKLQNIMLQITGHIKLVDFGLGLSHFTVGYQTYGYCGTVTWMAPEMVQRHAYGHSVDIWALGVFMYTVLTGKNPFGGDTKTDKENKVLRAMLTMPEGLSDGGKQLLKGILRRRVENRITIARIKESDFFKDVDWEKMKNQQYEPPFVPNVADSEDSSLFSAIDDDDSFMRMLLPFNHLMLI